MGGCFSAEGGNEPPATVDQKVVAPVAGGGGGVDAKVARAPGSEPGNVGTSHNGTAPASAPRSALRRTGSSGGAGAHGSGGGGGGGDNAPASPPASGLARSSDDSGARGVRFAATPGTTGDRRRSLEMQTSDSVSLKKVVDLFYTKVLSDPQLSDFFNGIDMVKLKNHQVKFMELAFGGKDLINEEHPQLNLRRIHQRLIRDKGLNEGHWERFVSHFKRTLDELPEIPAPTKATAMTSVNGTRHYFAPLDQEELAALPPAAAAPA